MGVDFEARRVHPRAPWTWLPVSAWPMPLASLRPDSDPIAPPWPDIVIASGRRAIPFALYIRRQSGGKSFAVYIQNPRTAFSRFDAIVAPEHDGISGPNVIVTKGAIHRVTRQRIEAEAARFADRVAHLPRPRVAVLIGGSNKVYRMTAKTMADLAGRLRDLAVGAGDDRNAGLMITPSRRTGDDNLRALRAALEGCPAEIWDFTGDNPYFGYLGLADHIVVTGDSVTMISEACSTGKPVYVVDLEGGSPKFDRFHAGLRAAGHVRVFTGELSAEPTVPMNETAEVAAEILRRIEARS